MKANKLRTVLLMPVALVTGIIVWAGVASAAPPDPTTPYPNVDPVAGACAAEGIKVAQAQALYDPALRIYNRRKAAFAQGVGSISDVRAAQKTLDEYAIALNTAKYAEAKCRNNAANPPNPAGTDCVNYALELNRLIDELAITQDLQAIANANFTDAAAALKRGVGSPDDVDTAQGLSDAADQQTKLVQQAINDLKKPAGCTLGARPATAPPPHVPTSTDAPTDTTSTSPVPIPSAS